MSMCAPLVKCSKDYMVRRKGYDQAAAMLQQITQQHMTFDAFKHSKLWNWQFSAFHLLKNENERKILWVVDPIGNWGKSWFCFYMNALYNYFICDGSLDSRDLEFTLPSEFWGILFDLCRNSRINFNYNTLESVKNGFLISGKYEGKIRNFKRVPVAVLTNFSPEYQAL